MSFGGSTGTLYSYGATRTVIQDLNDGCQSSELATINNRMIGLLMRCFILFLNFNNLNKRRVSFYVCVCGLCVCFINLCFELGQGCGLIKTQVSQMACPHQATSEQVCGNWKRNNLLIHLIVLPHICRRLDQLRREHRQSLLKCRNAQRNSRQQRWM